MNGAPTERAGVLIVRNGRLALVERKVHDQRYWVIPGGGIDPGEAAIDSAQREAEEELGVTVELGSLRVRIDHREVDGSTKRHWYFDASVRSELIRFSGPEMNSPDRGTYSAVWMELNDLDAGAIYPSAVARVVAQNQGVWPSSVIEIFEI
jgi:8-oxo-dGTP diphosphatase